MIGPSGALKVMIATKPVDFRKGAEGLAALVKAEMGADPFSGTIYQSQATNLRNRPTPTLQMSPIVPEAV